MLSKLIPVFMIGHVIVCWYMFFALFRSYLENAKALKEAVSKKRTRVNITHANAGIYTLAFVGFVSSWLYVNHLEIEKVYPGILNAVDQSLFTVCLLSILYVWFTMMKSGKDIKDGELTKGTQFADFGFIFGITWVFVDPTIRYFIYMS